MVRLSGPWLKSRSRTDRNGSNAPNLCSYTGWRYSWKMTFTPFFRKVKIHVIPAAGAGQVGIRPEVLRDGDQPFVGVIGKLG